MEFGKSPSVPSARSPQTLNDSKDVTISTTPGSPSMPSARGKQNPPSVPSARSPTFLLKTGARVTSQFGVWHTFCSSSRLWKALWARHIQNNNEIDLVLFEIHAIVSSCISSLVYSHFYVPTRNLVLWAYVQPVIYSNQKAINYKINVHCLCFISVPFIN